MQCFSAAPFLRFICLSLQQEVNIYPSFLLVVLRSSWEELKDGGGGPDAAHHHGHEGQDEDPWEEQARDLRGDPKGVQHLQDAPRSAHEERQAVRPGRHLEVVG